MTQTAKKEEEKHNKAHKHWKPGYKQARNREPKRGAKGREADCSDLISIDNRTKPIFSTHTATGHAASLATDMEVDSMCPVISIEKSVDFYQDILGFFPIKRPGSFDFSGAWLFSYGVGIHLLQSENPESMPEIRRINPKDNHISFQCQCDSMGTLEKKLKELNIEYVKGTVEEGGIRVDQLFFHDPDGCSVMALASIFFNQKILKACLRSHVLINPKDNHISFQCQCDSMGKLEKKLKELKIEYIRLL
ncbi:hypothetical protein GQ457_07G040880 [Hibiscus cannabinus]